MNSESELLDVMKRVEELLFVCAKAALAPHFDRECADDRLRRLYELTGVKSAEQICKELRMSKETVSKTWQRWETLGLLAKDGRGYRKALSS